MSQFTQWQTRRFSFLFDQYCSNIKAVKTFGARKEELTLNNRLGTHQLCELLARLGPEVTMEYSKEIIYRYDSSCTGCLEFEDYLEFLADYREVLNSKRLEATVHYEKMKKSKAYEDEQFITSFPVVANYIAHLKLDDPENYFIQTDPITEMISNNGYVNDPRILKRTIVVRIFGAKNLATFSRLKKREGVGIEYKTLNPVIRVSINGMMKSTTVILGSTTSEWNQDLVFPIHIPPGELHDVQSWVEAQNFVFHLYDFVSSGLVPHPELLAFGSISLSRVLLSTRKPFTAVIKMSPLGCSSLELEKVKLDVSLTDLTLENWAWAKVVDSFIHPEEVWRQLYPMKMKTDLELFSSGKQTVTDETSPWNQFLNLIKPLRHIFRRRAFHAIILDEYNTFRLMPALLRPIKAFDPRISSTAELCRSLSAIPFKKKTVPPSDLTLQIRALQNAHKSSEGFDSLSSNQVAAWTVAANPPDYLSENFFAQMSSPSSMLSRREGSLLEHAIALCSFLLGQSEDAYVAIGNVKQRCYIWVIVFKQKQPNVQKPFNNRMVGAEEENDGSYTYGPMDSLETFYCREFKALSKTKSIRKINDDLIISHYETATGSNFQNSKANSFPFDRISTLFNHRNIWYNIQHTDLISHPMFSWDTSNPECWYPVFSKFSIAAPASIQCIYMEPHFTNIYEYNLDYVRMDAPSILKELVSLIQLYRKNILFVAETPFHREICRKIQAIINQAEIQPDEKSNLPDTESEQRIFESQTSIDVEYPLENENGIINLRLIKERINSLLPDHYTWEGCIFQFNDSNLSHILEQLAWSGYLDCSVPDSLYTIACKIQRMPFGQTSLKLVIGYIYDILL